MRRKNCCQNLNDSCSSLNNTHLKNVEMKKYQHHIQAINEELEQSQAKNKEYSKLIDILTEERNFYQEELKRSEHEKHLLEEALNKYQIEMETKTILVNELKKVNRSLEEETIQAREELDETSFLFQAQEQQMSRILKEKQLIEAEWSRVIKDMNQKMKKVERKQKEEDKQNLQLYSNLPLEHKVQKALNQLNREIKSSGQSISSIDDRKDSSPTTMQEIEDFSI